MTDGTAPRLVALTLTDFRNYAHLSLDLDAPLVALTGENGAGKTNLLEAVSLLAPGRGLRRAAYAEMARRGAADGWAVAAEIAADPDGGPVRIGTGTMGLAEAGGAARQVRIDGARAPAEAMQEHLRMLWLTPAMDRLFAGPPGDRRRFLDRLVMALDPAHGRRMAGLDRLTASRNRLLEEGGERGWLDATEAELATSAVAASRARADTVRRLAARLAATNADEGGFPLAGVALEGEFEAAFGGMADADAASAFRTALAAARPRDRAAGRTLSGPHRSDLAVTFAEKAMPAALSSTGEQKALLIGLILAHADLVAGRSGLCPILLLDEIAAHLDENRRAALFSRLAGRGGQALMTGTDPALFDALSDDCLRLRVADGRVKAAD